MKEKIQKFREYLDYIEEHYDNVQKAWELIKDKCKDFKVIHDDWCFALIDQEVKNHDDSKLSVEEFQAYRQWFFPCSYEQSNKDIFDKAWEHHKKHNEHHWQNWTIIQNNKPYQEIYLVMNLIDWIAMGFKFGDTAKDYYKKNKNKIDIPKWAIEMMYNIFDRIYG
jgi:hypothetical protein